MTKPTSVCRQWHLDVNILSLVSNRRGTWAMAALGDGSLVVLPSDDAAEDPRIMKAHDGVSLETAPILTITRFCQAATMVMLI